MLPGKRRQLELEFHKWAKNAGARPDAFNLIGWLDEKGLLTGEAQNAMLIELRDEFRNLGWTQTAEKIASVIVDITKD